MFRLTIGLPVYNSEKYLFDCITSILNQRYGDFILLIIDDGSTDDSVNIIKSFKDERIRFLRDNQNKGLASRLNQITRLTETEYCARMDSDDIMHPDRIKKQMDVIEKNPNIDVLGTNAISIDEDNNILGVRKSKFKKNAISKVASFIHPSIIARTEWFKSNPYDEEAHRVEDAELWFRTKGKSNFVMLNTPLLYYREALNGRKGIISMFKIWKKYFLNYSFLFGFFWIKYILVYISKSLIYSFIVSINKGDLLIQRRSSKLSNERKRQLKLDLINAIRKDSIKKS